MQADFSKNNGLISVILQDYNTKQVLMNGYMNEEAYRRTKEEGLVCFYSRSRQKLWLKGETSGNYQKVVDMHLDCDGDALLITVIPAGPTCHTGNISCFDEAYFNLEILEKTIQDRIQKPKEGSYTKYLIDQGLDKILKKCGEEMTETVIACKNRDRAEIRAEASDLLYHLILLLNFSGLTLEDVKAELADRHGQAHSYKKRQAIQDW